MELLNLMSYIGLEKINEAHLLGTPKGHMEFYSERVELLRVHMAVTHVIQLAREIQVDANLP